MVFGRHISSDIYQRALDQFMSEVNFYAGEVRTYILDLSMGERLMFLCGFIMFLMYLIVARSRRKYNPGSPGRQFVAAVLLVGVMVYAGSIIFGNGGGNYSGLFRI